MTDAMMIRKLQARPCLARAARNAALSRLRMMKHEPLPLEEDLIVLPDDGPDEIAARREQEEIVRETVRRFREPDREVFLRFISSANRSGK